MPSSTIADGGILYLGRTSYRLLSNCPSVTWYVNI